MVLQRAAIPERAGWIQDVARIVAAGWLIVAECDDDPALMARIDPRPKDPDQPDLFDALLASVHAVQTSTGRLAARFGLRARTTRCARLLSCALNGRTLNC